MADDESTKILRQITNELTGDWDRNRVFLNRMAEKYVRDCSGDTIPTEELSMVFPELIVASLVKRLAWASKCDKLGVHQAGSSSMQGATAMNAMLAQPGRLGVRLGSWLLLCVLPLLLTQTVMKHTPMLVEERVRLDRYLDETAHRPFMFRVLVPRSIRLLKATIPDAAVKPIADRVMNHLLPRSLEDPVDKVAHFYLSAILCLSLLGYALVGARLYLRLLPPVPYPEVFAVGFLLLLVPFTAGITCHLYDFTLLLLMAALLYAIATHQHALYLILFTVSCFNKETTLFASVAYTCYFADRMPWKAFIPMVLAQGLIFVLIYFSLHRYYAGNGGTNLEFWLAEQLKFLGRRSFADYLSWLGGVLLVAFHWPDKPLMMRRSMWMVVPNVCLVATSAFPGEVRNLYESLPLLSLFVLHNIRELVVGADSPLDHGEKAVAAH